MAKVSHSYYSCARYSACTEVANFNYWLLASVAEKSASFWLGLSVVGCQVGRYLVSMSLCLWKKKERDKEEAVTILIAG